MEVHGTVYYETQRPPEVPAFVKNHGLLPQHELQTLLRRAKVGRHLHLNTYPLKHMHRNVIGLSVSASDLVEVREYGEEKKGAHNCSEYIWSTPGGLNLEKKYKSLSRKVLTKELVFSKKVT